MHLPFIQPAEQSREIVEEFRGYNHNLRIGDNEFYEETNITGDFYPVLAPRAKKAAEISSTGRVQGMLSKGALYYVKGRTLYCGDTATPVTGLTETPKQLVSMGAYIVIFPDGVYYNTTDATDRGAIAYTNNYTATENKSIIFEYVDSNLEAYTLTTKVIDGVSTVCGKICVDDKEPQNTDEYPRWLIHENNQINGISEYSESAGMWTSLARAHIKITAPGIAANVREGDSVMLKASFLDFIEGHGTSDAYDSSVYYALIAAGKTEEYALAHSTGHWQEYVPSGNERLFPGMFDKYHAVEKIYHDPSGSTDDYIIIEGLFESNNEYKRFFATNLYRTQTGPGGTVLLPPRKSKIYVSNVVPKMDFVTESNNRLWGCRYGTNNDGELVNEIYASKLGDFRNWNYFQGTSMDSYTASCGTDGEFTGAITHLNYPLFFKENFLHKVFGNYPANFQITSSPCRGVAKGAGRSLAIVNESVYYKSRGGVCVYDGSLPYEVSGALGNVRYTGHDGTGEPLADYPLIYGAVGGAAKNKYYISMKSEATGDWHLFVYDTILGIWHREDNTRATGFSFVGSTLYYSDDNKIMKYDSGEGGTFSERIPWSVTTGFLGLSLPYKKYITAITFKMSLEIGASASFSIQYDGAGQYQHITTVYGAKLQSFTVPIKPRRCDYFRIRIDGVGDAKLYNIIKTIEAGSEK